MFLFFSPFLERLIAQFLKPSHHIPYLYALAGAAYKTQERVREIAQANYDNTPIGLSGVSALSGLACNRENRRGSYGVPFRTKTAAR